MGYLLTYGTPFLSLAAFLINTLLNLLMPKQKPKYPPIRNKLLTKSAVELMLDIRSRKVKSEELVRAYIERVKEVNVYLNAVIDERFAEALKEARHVDELIEKSQDIELLALTKQYPLLGLPFTVKEACSLKGLSWIIDRVDRMKTRCTEDSEVVQLLRAAGAIPLLVSATPDYCLSLETNTKNRGRCRNPYDLVRTSAGSSGGEGALNGAGASLFGLAADTAGSIRLPSLFCGVFGHKPTGGLVSTKGHFPNSSDEASISKFLQLGPMTRFAKDLPLLLQIMAGENSKKLEFDRPVKLTNIKIYYALGFDGFNGLRHPPVTHDIKVSIWRAVKYLQNKGLSAQEVKIKGFQNSLEISLAAMLSIDDLPSMLTEEDRSKLSSLSTMSELMRNNYGHSLYTREAVLAEYLQCSNIVFSDQERDYWKNEIENVSKELATLLGNNGVLFFPTFHTSALCFRTALWNVAGADMMMIFNVLGFPSTHVPMGFDRRSLPIGFQVVAAPYQDKLCFEIAMALETGFGGWKPAIEHEF